MNHRPLTRDHSLTVIARGGISLAIVLLILVGALVLGRHTRDGFAVPSYWLLAMLSCTLVIPLKAGTAEAIQRILAAYLVALSVDCVAGVYLPLGGSLQVAAGLLVTAAAFVAVWVAPSRPSQGQTSGELAAAVGGAMVLIGAFLLVTGLLVQCWYGYGAERSLGVLGQLGMAMLTAMAAWRLAIAAALRITVGVAGIAMYCWMAFS